MSTTIMAAALLRKVAPKVAVATVVLALVTVSSELGNPLLAAVAATAPVTLPLALYVVVQVAADNAADSGPAPPVGSRTDPTEATAVLAAAMQKTHTQQEQVEAFLWLTCKGMVATLSWCLGALWASRNGFATSFGALAFVGFTSWAVVWETLQSL